MAGSSQSSSPVETSTIDKFQILQDLPLLFFNTI